jgi:hypothetical protein
MKTLELRVSDNLLDRVLQVLHNFPSQEVQVIQKDESIANIELKAALRGIQQSAKQSGLDIISDADINSEIAAVRQEF